MIALLACSVVLVSMFAYSRHLPDVVVMRTDTGFSPARVTIRKGQAVVFRSASSSPMWPASDSHPSHGIYPEFDARKPVDSWRFVFEKAGVWTFHDHMNETARGIVVVIGAPGESMRTCLNLNQEAPAGVRAECWAAQLTETMQKDGLEAAFDEYAQLYAQDPSFRGLSCHDAGHTLGTEAYKLFENDHTVTRRPETSYCGYGFYHGFIETMLLDTGPGEYEAIRSYCNALKINGQLDNPSGACYHGIGHAVFDSLPSSQWGDESHMIRSAIAACEIALSAENERTQCVDGAFNALAVAQSAREYGLSFGDQPSLALCAAQPEVYRESCHKEYGIGVIREHQMTRDEALRFIRSQGDLDSNSGIVFGYIADETVRAVASIDLQDFYNTCRQFTGTARIACDRAVLASLNQAATPGAQYVSMFAYCALFADTSERTACYAYAIQQSRESVSDKNAYARACELIGEPTLASKCRE